MGWVGLSEQRLARHRLVSSFNDGMVCRTALAREAHLQAQCEEPYMQACGKRGRSGVIVEDGAIIQGQGLRQTIREECSTQAQLVIG